MGNANSGRKTEVYITYRGERKSAREWSKITGINRYTLTNRIRLLRWDAERALKTKARRKLRNGERVKRRAEQRKVVTAKAKEKLGLVNSDLRALVLKAERDMQALLHSINEGVSSVRVDTK